VVAEILPGRTESLSLRTTFGARGRQPLKEMILTSEFPFGLVRRGGYFTPAATCLVYPRPERVAWRFLESAEREGEEHSMPLAGVGGDYRGLREYLPGDSLSRVQWKGWLRHRRLMTKEFESEGASPVIFSFDKVPGPDAESRISQLTWLVRAGFRRGKAVGLVLPGRTFPPAVGALHRKNILTALALYGAEDAVTADQPSL